MDAPKVELNITPGSNGTIVKINGQGQELNNVRSVRVTAGVNRPSYVTLDLIACNVSVTGSVDHAIGKPADREPEKDDGLIDSTDLRSTARAYEVAPRYRFVNVYRTKDGFVWVSGVGVATMAEADRLAAGIKECCDSQRINTESVPYDPANHYVNFFESRGRVRQGAAHPTKEMAAQIGKIAEPLYGPGARYLGSVLLLA